MVRKSTIAWSARSFVFASLFLSLITVATTAQSADPPALFKVTLRGLDGRRANLAPPAGGATTVVFYSTECPISNGYSPTLIALVDSFGSKPVKWLGVCVDPDLSDSEVEAHARDFGLKLGVVRDRQGAIARKLGIPRDSPKRAQAAVRHVLSEGSSNGHVGLPEPVVIEQTVALTQIASEIIVEAIGERLQWVGGDSFRLHATLARCLGLPRFRRAGFPHGF